MVSVNSSRQHRKIIVSRIITERARLCAVGDVMVQVQKLTDKCTKELDELAKTKEKELNTV